VRRIPWDLREAARQRAAAETAEARLEALGGSRDSSQGRLLGQQGCRRAAAASTHLVVAAEHSVEHGLRHDERVGGGTDGVDAA